MTDRDRLIKTLNDWARANNDGIEAESIADYLLANGVIVPPCKVGDTVYSFCDTFGVILPYEVQNFSVGFLGKDRPNHWYWEATSHATETDELLDEIDFEPEDIGKTVFLTKEEAEAELRKIGEDNA